jgi:hypothetical protein
MGTQSQEAVNLAAAIAREGARTAGQSAAQTAEKLADEVDAARSSVADVGSKISGAANWAVDKATVTARAAADHVRIRAPKAVESSVDP